MAEITINAGVIESYSGGESTLYLHIYCNKTFGTLDGEVVQEGKVGSNNFYRRVLCTVGAGLGGTNDYIHVPSFIIDSTTDGGPNDSSYTLILFTTAGDNIGEVASFLVIPPTPTTTTLAALLTYNAAIDGTTSDPDVAGDPDTSTTWNKIQRSVILRSNQLQADSASALASAYNRTIGQAQMADRAIEFPFTAINDAILDACDCLISVIGADPSSPYRNFFAGVTGNLTSGVTIPLVSTLAKPRVGTVGEVREASTGKMMVLRPYQDVAGVGNMQLKQVPLWYYTDNTRVWHTKATVIADIVVWDKAEQITLMTSSPRGECPFPQDLHEAIICGSLSYLFRGDFNNEQVAVWTAKFAQTLQKMESAS